MNKLAIVIPSYKDIYLEQTLDSIAAQTCKEFTLYIGDDASPYNLRSIVNKYCDNVKVVYKKFENNLGYRNLVSHWARCIDLVQDEEWIWLFADDDLMSNDCVSGFYETLNKYEGDSIKNKVFRFNLIISDKNLDKTKSVRYTTPEEFTVEYFLKRYFIDHTLTNRAIEFVFSKKKFYEKGGFVNFPLAWGTDTATILNFGKEGGFITIDKGEVYWRDSGFNITSSNEAEFNVQKPFIINQFYYWICGFILIYKDSPLYEKLIFRILHKFSKLPTINSIEKLSIEKSKLYYKVIIWIIFIKIKRILRYKKIKIALKKYLISN